MHRISITAQVGRPEPPRSKLGSPRHPSAAGGEVYRHFRLLQPGRRTGKRTNPRRYAHVAGISYPIARSPGQNLV